MSHVVLFAYPIKLNISIKNTVTKFYQRSYIVILSHLCNATKKILDKICVIATLRFLISDVLQLFQQNYKHAQARFNILEPIAKPTSSTIITQVQSCGQIIQFTSTNLSRHVLQDCCRVDCNGFHFTRIDSHRNSLDHQRDVLRCGR